ncbi:hypothetical protein, partial [Staphylococcus aureus]
NFAITDLYAHSCKWIINLIIFIFKFRKLWNWLLVDTGLLFVDGMRRSQASIGTGHIYDD